MCNIFKSTVFPLFFLAFQVAIAVGKLTLHLKFKRDLKRMFLLLLRFLKKRIKLKDSQKMSEERGTPTASFHARMIEGFYRKSTECPSFQLAATSFPRRKTARIRHERACARRWFAVWSVETAENLGFSNETSKTQRLKWAWQINNRQPIICKAIESVITFTS